MLYWTVSHRHTAKRMDVKRKKKIKIKKLTVQGKWKFDHHLFFVCFKLIIQDHIQKQTKTKFEPRIKIDLKHKHVLRLP